MASAGSKAVKAGLKEIIDLVEDYIASGGDIKKILTGKRSMTEAQMKKQVKQKGKLIPSSPRLKGEEAAARPSYLQRPKGRPRTQAGSQKGLSGKQKPNLKQPLLAPLPSTTAKNKARADHIRSKEKKIKAKKKKSDTSWMSGLSSDEIKSILGITTVDPITGIRGHRKKGGQVLQKRHGGMTRVGLSPAEEARAGTMSEAKRARYMRGGGPIHTTFSKRATPRTEGRAPAVDLFPEVGRKKGKKVGKKEQGYKARKDESIAERVKKKRTPKQLKASRHESYGKPGSGKGKGKINRISSKQTDGNKLVASLYD